MAKNNIDPAYVIDICTTILRQIEAGQREVITTHEWVELTDREADILSIKISVGATMLYGIQKRRLIELLKKATATYICKKISEGKRFVVPVLKGATFEKYVIISYKEALALLYIENIMGSYMIPLDILKSFAV